jgi:hypothetical protein
LELSEPVGVTVVIDTTILSSMREASSPKTRAPRSAASPRKTPAPHPMLVTGHVCRLLDLDLQLVDEGNAKLSA